MGAEFSRRGWQQQVQSLTQASTGTRIKAAGVTFIASNSTAGSNFFVLNPPKFAGQRKSLIVDVNSTDDVTVQTAASINSSGAGFIWGTTAQGVKFSTGAVPPKRAVLVGVSTSQWAVEYLSTGVTLVGTTTP